MSNFTYYAPTELFFGEGVTEKIGQTLAAAGYKKILLHFGGNSAQKSGLLERVKDNLQEAGLACTELGGVVPNPHLDLVYQGINLCRRENVDFILAIGGGSVIDSAKAIGLGVTNHDDVWEIFTRKAPVTKASLPLGAVLTIPAAGSEMSNASVITKKEGQLKRGFQHDALYCRYAFLDPVLTYTLPPYQTASGTVDIMMHTLERYFTAQETLPLVDDIAETLLRSVMHHLKIVLKEPDNYTSRANLMWASTLSHNGVTGDRNYGDWACHQLEHELSGMFDVAHGAGLAAVWSSWARYVLRENPARFAQLAVNVLGVPNRFGRVELTALEGIAAMEEFFRSIGMPTDLRGLGLKPNEVQIKELAFKCSFMATRTIGAFKKLSLADIEEIYRRAR